eukprot:jgi/Hompol1/5846/HPOL_004735-RA
MTVCTYLTYFNNKRFLDEISRPFDMIVAVVVAVVCLATLIGLMVLQRVYLYILIGLVLAGIALVPYYMIFIEKNLQSSPEKE